ncbi:MAG: hypothetical protein ACP5N6_09500 [Anaerolineae bacterium]
MQFLKSAWGTATMEWLIVAAIVVSLIGTILFSLAQAIGNRLESIANGL